MIVVGTGVRLAICDSLSFATVVLLNDLGASFLESQKRMPGKSHLSTSYLVVESKSSSVTWGYIFKMRSLVFLEVLVPLLA
jgi:hypothetical protein